MLTRVLYTSTMQGLTPTSWATCDANARENWLKGRDDKWGSSSTHDVRTRRFGLVEKVVDNCEAG